MTEESAVVSADTQQAPEASDAAPRRVFDEQYFQNTDLALLEPTMEALLVAGAHFGHNRSKKHPKMTPYIYGTRNGVSIIDLTKTRAGILQALEVVKSVTAEGKSILFVGTKKQAQRLVVSCAMHAGMPYVIDRWLGGTLTNFSVIRGRVKFLIDQEAKDASGEFSKYTKLEQMRQREEMRKLTKKLGGIRTMETPPGLVFATDLKMDTIAIREAHKMNILTMGIADTNSDPSLVDYAIPANDDALSSLALILGLMCRAIREARATAPTQPVAPLSGKSEEPSAVAPVA